MIHHFEDDSIDLPFLSVHHIFKGTVFFSRNRPDLMGLWFFSDYINSLFAGATCLFAIVAKVSFLPSAFFLESLEVVGVPFHRPLEEIFGFFLSLDGSLMGSFVIPPFAHWKWTFRLHLIIFCRYHLDSIWDDEHFDV